MKRLKCLFLGHQKVEQGIFIKGHAYKRHCKRCEKGFDYILFSGLVSMHPPFRRGQTEEERKERLKHWNEYTRSKYPNYKYLENYLPTLETSWQNKK